MEYHSALQRNESLTCATTPTNLKDMMLMEIHQTQPDTKDKYSPIPLPWGAQNTQIHRKWEGEWRLVTRAAEKEDWRVIA